MLNDLRFAIRMIASRRWFSAAVITTLALGIGLNTMVFTLINAALFKPVPVPGGERLLAISGRNLEQDRRGMGISYPDFREYRKQASTMETVEAANGALGILSEQGNPPRSYQMNRVSSGLFSMLRIQPVLGRGFAPTDDQPGAAPVLLLGYGIWNDRYALSPNVIGRVVRVNSKPATIIGVMPAGFKFPNNEDMWIPLVPDSDLEDRTHHWLQLFAIRKPGVFIPQASADMERIAARLAADHPKENRKVGVKLQTFHERYNGGPIKTVFLLMLASVGFVLLIACANIANMMLGRALGRVREISIRIAMGASRWQLIRQLLTESLLLSALGGVLGLALSVEGVHWFNIQSADVGKPYWVQFSADYSVFGYFAGLCVLSGVLFGLFPALRSTRVDLNSALKEGGRSMGSKRGGMLSTVLVVFQFGLTLVLLTGAGMFARAFLESEKLNPGVPADRLLTAQVSLPQIRYATPETRFRFFDKLLPKIEALPGVTNAVLVSQAPGLGAPSRHIEIEHTVVPDPARLPSASYIVQTPGYFNAVNLPLLTGRDFNESDGLPGHETTVVTKNFAAHFWPNQNALGKRLRFFNDEETRNSKTRPWLSVIGISADLDQEPGEADPNPLIFVPLRQESSDSMSVMLRSASNPSSLSSAMRAAVQSLDEDLPLSQVRTLTEAVEHQQWYIRIFGTLFLTFAIIALLIASVGIYAVIAQSTAARTQEIGVRMALGATSRNVLAMVLARGAWQLTAGLITGLAVAFPAARLMKSILARVSPSDPLVFGAVSLLLIAVGMFACWLPARRAAALDPVKAIRYE
jgi:putative ABC transport system permease protein